MAIIALMKIESAEPQPTLSPLPTKQKKHHPTRKPFRFLDLPAELRNTIYRLVLTRTHEIRCHLHKTGLTLLRSRQGDRLTTTLLATCRQIRNEALSISYGENTFRITRISEDEPHSPAATIALLRHVVTDERFQKYAKKVFTYLKQAKQLRRLTVEWETRIQFKTPEKMALALTPLIRALAKGKAESEKACVLEIYDFPASARYSHSVDSAQKAKDFGDRVKELLRLALGLPEN